MSTVLVTGANGLLATNIIIELLSRSYSVKGMLRNIDNFQYNNHPNLELIQGNITENQSVEKAIKNCDYVIHAAALTNPDQLYYSDYQYINATATKNLILKAIEENLEKFVYVGTANAFGYGTKENPGDESVKIKKPFTTSYYAVSKLEGQDIALSFKDKINTTVVNPTFMLGGYDSKPSSGTIILMGYKKRIILYPPGGKNFVHVKDAARGVVNALEFGKNGEAYLLSNENLSYKEFFDKLSDLTENRPVYVKLPRFVLLTIGVFGSFLRILGIKTSLSLTNMRILCINNFYSNNKATRELNLVFQPVENAIEEAVDWFRKRKIL